MLDFNNTQRAYAYKSNRDLRMAYALFSAMNSNFLMKSVKSASDVAVRLGIPLNWVLKPTLYRQFVGGETIDECKEVVKRLYNSGIESILDYSAESSSELSDIEEAYDEILKTIENARVNPAVAFAVFKPSAIVVERILKKAAEDETALGIVERGEYDNFRQRFFSLCERAYEAGVKVMVDAEKFAAQSLVDAMTVEAMQRFNKERAVIFITLQMYRRDRFDYLKFLHKDAIARGYILGVKFVRGAYMEEERARAFELGYPDPILPEKAATDKSFNDGLAYAVENIDNFEIFCGTHNYESTNLLADLMDKKELGRGDKRIYFAQLYGMSDNITYTLANEGYNVCKYIPYAPVRKVLPYLFRRIEENRSVAGQTGRELELIKREMERRRISK